MLEEGHLAGHMLCLWIQQLYIQPVVQHSISTASLHCIQNSVTSAWKPCLCVCRASLDRDMIWTGPYLSGWSGRAFLLPPWSSNAACGPPSPASSGTPSTHPCRCQLCTCCPPPPPPPILRFPPHTSFDSFSTSLHEQQLAPPYSIMVCTA